MHKNVGLTRTLTLPINSTCNFRKWLPWGPKLLGATMEHAAAPELQRISCILQAWLITYLFFIPALQWFNIWKNHQLKSCEDNFNHFSVLLVITFNGTTCYIPPSAARNAPIHQRPSSRCAAEIFAPHRALLSKMPSREANSCLEYEDYQVLMCTLVHPTYIVFYSML